MSLIALFRFHKSYDICLQTLRLMKKMNPDLAIYGLYGGNDDLEAIPYQLSSLMESIWKIPLDDPHYKWLNGDLCVRWWFKEYGHKLAFDHVILTEWDMIFIRPMETVLPPLEKDKNYGSIFGDYQCAKSFDWHWLFDGHYAYETEELLKVLAKDSLYADLKKLNFAVMGGAIFCRRFLERFSAMPVPSYSNDELRFCVYSAAFGIPLLDNGFYSKKNRFTADTDKYTQYDGKTLQKLYRDKVDVIHPLRNIIENIGSYLAE